MQARFSDLAYERKKKVSHLDPFRQADFVDGYGAAALGAFGWKIQGAVFMKAMPFGAQAKSGGAQ